MSVIFNGSFTSGWQSKTGAISNFAASCIISADRFQALFSYAGRYNVGKFIIKDGDGCDTTHVDETTKVYSSWPASVIGTTQWYGFSLMLDPSWVTSGQWFMFWKYGWSTEVIGIDVGNKLWIKHYIPNKTTSVLIPLIPGQWYNFLIKLKISYGTDGIYEISLRRPGESVYTVIHSSTGVTAESGALVHQLGESRGGLSTNTQIIYIADYKVGTEMLDVIPEIVFTPTPTSTLTPTPSPAPICGFNITQEV